MPMRIRRDLPLNSAIFTQLPYSESPILPVVEAQTANFDSLPRINKGCIMLRCWLRNGLACSATITMTLASAQSSFGQLRTGRDSDRDFYSDNPSVVVKENLPVATGKPKSSAASGVVKASHQTTKAASEPAKLNRPHVVQASCKNCQAGIPHTHAPASVLHESVELPARMQDEVVFETGVATGSLAHDGCCDSLCGPSCGPAFHCYDVGLAKSLNFISQVICRSQLRIEAATFWPDGQNLPQLVTTRRPANDPATDGLIGRSDTINLFGGSEVLGESTQGIRGELGTYFDASRSHGVLLRFFDAGSNSLSYSSTPTSEPVVMRPFLNITSNAQSTIAVNYPNSTSGSLNANISSELYGGDLLFRKLFLQDCCSRLEFLAGYQTARLADDLRIDSTTTALTNTPAPQGTVSELTDHFQTTNRFHGMALGIQGFLRENAWSLAGMFKLGMGNMERSVLIDGSSTITVPGNPASTNTTANGLLARSTNSGSYVQDTFIVSPEVNVTLGYRFTRNLDATVGYSYLGLPKVARVANQLDPDLAANLSDPLTGAIRPGFLMTENNFSLHSLNYGLQWRY